MNISEFEVGKTLWWFELNQDLTAYTIHSAVIEAVGKIKQDGILPQIVVICDDGKKREYSYYKGGFIMSVWELNMAFSESDLKAKIPQSLDSLISLTNELIAGYRKDIEAQNKKISKLEALKKQVI